MSGGNYTPLLYNFHQIHYKTEHYGLRSEGRIVKEKFESSNWIFF